jgi:cathepsin X
VRVIRGINNMGLESNCSWATPIDTWSNDTRHHLTEQEKNDPRNPGPGEIKEPTPQGLFNNSNTCRAPKVEFKNGPKPLAVHAWEEDLEVPDALDWRNVNGSNFLSWNKNQHIPKYCGSCWAQGSTSALADRFNIIMKNKSPTPVALNAQVIVNCRAGGSCEGGNPGGVYEYAHEEGIPHSSCVQYVADDGDGECTAMERCKDCTPPPCPIGQKCQDKCWAVDHKPYYASHFYSLSGAKKMKAEILKYGPISCGISVTDKFEKYKSGIFSQFVLLPMINHEISVVGWGSENGEEYWIGRNSWGTYWGEDGFFRMATGHHGLGIESDCSAGIPSFEKPSSDKKLEFLSI